MKKIIMTASLALVSLLALPNKADAGIRISVGHCSTYVSGHSSCGCPIYTKRVCYGHDRYHRPLYRYYRQPFSCKHRSHYRHSPRHYSGYGYYNGVRRSHYGYRATGRGDYRHPSYHRRGYSSKSCGRSYKRR